MRFRIITARIDGKIEGQIEYLKRHLNMQNTTQVLKNAVTNLYKTVKQSQKKKSPFELLEELNLIGCLDAEPDLSTNYKKKISDSLVKKHRSAKGKT